MFAFGGPVSALAVTLLPHELERLAAVPIGVGLAWLGYALWSERRAHALEPRIGGPPAPSRAVAAEAPAG